MSVMSKKNSESTYELKKKHIGTRPVSNLQPSAREAGALPIGPSRHRNNFVMAFPKIVCSMRAYILVIPFKLIAT